MFGHPMPKIMLIVGGLVTMIVGLLALLEAMGTLTIFGAMGLPWLYLMMILMGLMKLTHPFMCPQCKM